MKPLNSARYAMQDDKLFDDLTNGSKTIDSVLYPGKQLCDFDEDSLTIKVLPTGFQSFDASMVFKRNRGELILIGARPSHGKSALLFQLATNIARSGKAHAFSLEMDHESVATRQIASLGKVSIDAIQAGLRKDLITEGKNKLSKLNFIIDDRSGLTVEQICDAARVENKRSKTDAIFIDYIQIIDTEKSHNRAAEIASISNQLKELAKELRIPVVVASQLNRNNEFRENKTPQLSDLKESGSLEQDADVVILLYRDPQSPHLASVNIAKNRNGPTKELRMEYLPARTCFEEKPGSNPQLLPQPRGRSAGDDI